MRIFFGNTSYRCSTISVAFISLVLLGLMRPVLADEWQNRNTVLSARTSHSVVWTGTEMIAWGGGGEGTFLRSGGCYNPVDDAWRLTTLSNAPAGRWFHRAVWTGSEMIIWGGRANFDSRNHFADGGRYDPVSDTWKRMATNGAPSPRSQHAMVWTGSEMLVWGGMANSHVGLADGGRYNPATDTWTPMSNVNVPSPRYSPTAVWTGTELIIWGGFRYSGVWTAYNDGARYNPVTDTWTSMSSTNAPSPRHDHTGVWTGTELLVWGGADASSHYFNDGARYDLATDTWAPMSVAGAPQPRACHASVWTGSELLVWGGANPIPSGVMNTGGRYLLATDTWSPMTQSNAPPARHFYHPEGGIWTGEGMLAFGGSTGSGMSAANSYYLPGEPAERAPAITVQPESQTVSAGTEVTLKVVATGNPPPIYIWFFNGQPMSGPETSTRSLGTVGIEDMGDYSVLVTNDLGGVMSDVAKLTVIAPPTTCVEPPSGLVSWWPAEGNPLDRVDGNHGTISTGGFAPGLVGQAFTFDGVSQTVRVPNSPSLNPTNALTLETWLLVDAFPASGGASIAGKEMEYAERQYKLGIVHDGSKWVLRGHIGVPGRFVWFEGETGLVTNTWYHAAMTFDGQTAKVYVNGILDGSLAVSGPLITSVHPFMIGGNLSGPWFFSGRVDELSLYGRALSEHELLAIYLAGVLGKCVHIEAPHIAKDPVSQTVDLGSVATFSVEASGTPPLSYSWWFNDAPIAGANGASLNLGNVDASDAGHYFAVITNLAGSVTSQVATLVVNSAPFSDIYNGSFEMGLSGWTFTNAVHLYGPPASSAAGTDGTHAANIGGYDTPNSALWQAVAVNPGATYRLLFDSACYSAVGTTGTSFMEVAIISGAQVLASLPYSDVGHGLLNGTNGFSPRQLVFTVPATVTSVVVKFTDRTPNGGYRIDGDIDNVRLLPSEPAIPLSIVMQPQSAVALQGDDVMLAVAAQGTPPLSYQWWFNGETLSGANEPSLALNGVQPAQAGAYVAVVANAAGAVTSQVAVVRVLVPPAECLPVPSGLLSWWRGEDNAVDSTSGNDGVLWNGPTFAAGKVGQAFAFNGLGQCVRVPNAPSLNPTNGLTLEAWVWVAGYPASGGATIAGKEMEYAERQYKLGIVRVGNEYVVRAHVGVPGRFVWFEGHTPLATNAWYHTAMTYDGLELKIYVNGQLDGSLTVGGPVVTSPHPFIIGGNLSGPWFFNGRLDEVSLYGRALDAAEIEAVYAAKSLGKCLVVQPPAITRQPASRTAPTGEDVVFDVEVSGTHPLTYQWWFKGEPIPGATAASLLLPAVQSANAGSYSVVVANQAGAVTSQAATLTVIPPVSVVARITVGPLLNLWPEMPAPVVLAENGSNAVVVLDGTLSTGAGPLSYLWLIDGLPVGTDPILEQVLDLGEHEVTLQVSDGQATGSESMTVVVTDASEAVDSILASVTSSGLPHNELNPIKKALELAAQAFDRGRIAKGIHELKLFQEKVARRLSKSHPALAESWIEAAQVLIDALLDPLPPLRQLEDQLRISEISASELKLARKELQRAEEAFVAGKLRQGVHGLMQFQARVARQFSASHPDLADAWMLAAQDLIDLVGER